VTSKRITRITLETNEIIGLRRSGRAGQGMCSCCGSALGGVTPEEVASLLRLDIADVYREKEAGRLHVLSAVSDSPEICLDSLEKAAPLLLPGHCKLQIKRNLKSIEENPS
jgi:hypothetical protein